MNKKLKIKFAIILICVFVLITLLGVALWAQQPFS